MSSAVTRAQAELGIEDGLQEEDQSKRQALARASAEEIELNGRKKFYWLRTKWSFVIVIWITVLIWFNCYLAYMIGTSQWSFTGYEWFITSVTVETFLQVVGLGYVAAKFLFSRG